MGPLRKIFVYLLLVIFLIPAAGFYYTRHSCQSSGNEQMVLNEDYTCCSGSEIISCESPKSVKSESKTLEDIQCCSNEGKYLKSKKEYSSPSRAKAPHIEIIITLAVIEDQPSSGAFSGIGKYSHPPPISSRDILLRNGIQLI